MRRVERSGITRALSLATRPLANDIPHLRPHRSPRRSRPAPSWPWPSSSCRPEPCSWTMVSSHRREYSRPKVRAVQVRETAEMAVAEVAVAVVAAAREWWLASCSAASLALFIASCHASTAVQPRTWSCSSRCSVWKRRQVAGSTTCAVRGAGRLGGTHRSIAFTAPLGVKALSWPSNARRGNRREGGVMRRGLVVYLPQEDPTRGSVPPAADQPSAGAIGCEHQRQRPRRDRVPQAPS